MKGERKAPSAAEEKVREKRKAQPPRKNQSFVVLSDIEGLIQDSDVLMVPSKEEEQRKKKRNSKQELSCAFRKLN